MHKAHTYMIHKRDPRLPDGTIALHPLDVREFQLWRDVLVAFIQSGGKGDALSFADSAVVEMRRRVGKTLTPVVYNEVFFETEGER